MNKYDIKWDSEKDIYLYRGDKFKSFDYVLYTAEADLEQQ